MVVKNQTILCTLPSPVPEPLWAGGSLVGQLQDCTHSCGSLWAVWVALLPQWHLLASAVSIVHSELPLVHLIVSHHLQILCLNLIRNLEMELLTEKWSSLLELSNRPWKWRTLLL